MKSRVTQYSTNVVVSFCGKAFLFQSCDEYTTEQAAVQAVGETEQSVCQKQPSLNPPGELHEPWMDVETSRAPACLKAFSYHWAQERSSAGFVSDLTKEHSVFSAALVPLCVFCLCCHGDLTESSL